ncbi:MAG TPA: glutathione-disulfide reductase [Stellaceae bacterium]|jgi:glutathione reductase (NADPH)|nr:glutathione-disulfide reductase [Stellaceae bacterium]
MSTKYDFDLFTIGAGSGGVAASRRAASYGAKVALAENSRIGGTCVMRGCVPKKLLVYGAQFADAFADAAGFGWKVTPPLFDWPTLIANKNKELDRLEGIYRNLLKDCALHEARATIDDPHTISLSSGKRVTAETILVATGSHPVMPKIPGIEHVITSNEALELPALPRRIIIVGGGYIALEFANIFSGFKAEVTLVIRGEEVLNGFDDDLRVDIAKEMRQRGITIHARTELERIDKIPGGFTARTKAGAELSADLVMYATGRKPNTRGFGLAEAGVKLHEDGRALVDEWSKTSVPNIYAIGDVTDRLNLTPVAIAEGRAIAETLYNNNPMMISHDNVATAVFSQPPIGTVGLSEREARQRGHKLDVYRARFKPMKNTLSGREERTMMKLVVDRPSQRVLGVHMIGIDAPEIVQSLAVAIICGATKQQFDRTMAVHPTAAEEFVTMRDKLPGMDNEAGE